METPPKETAPQSPRPTIGSSAESLPTAFENAGKTMERTDDLENRLDSQGSTPGVNLFQRHSLSLDPSWLEEEWEDEEAKCFPQRTPSFSEPLMFPKCTGDCENFPSQLGTNCNEYDAGTLWTGGEALASGTAEVDVESKRSPISAHDMAS